MWRLRPSDLGKTRVKLYPGMLAYQERLFSKQWLLLYPKLLGCVLLYSLLYSLGKLSAAKVALKHIGDVASRREAEIHHKLGIHFHGITVVYRP